jgi:hypothetical protein
MRGLGGGLLGGFLGSMLFGGMGHAGMGGGFGGSGIGLFEILIIGGFIYFLYKKFSGRNRSGGSSVFSPGGGYNTGGGYQECFKFTIPTAGYGVRGYPDMASGDSVHGGTGYDPALRPGI